LISTMEAVAVEPLMSSISTMVEVREAMAFKVDLLMEAVSVKVDTEDPADMALLKVDMVDNKAVMAAHRAVMAANKAAMVAKVAKVVLVDLADSAVNKVDSAGDPVALANKYFVNESVI
jgi:hypothetical protein